MKFRSDAQRRAVFARLGSCFSRGSDIRFSSTEFEIRKMIQDIDAGLINPEDLPEEDLRDIDAYIESSAKGDEDLRKFRRTYGPSKVIRGTEYGSQYYTACMRNKPVVKEYIILALSTVMDEDDLKEFEATGKLDDSVVSNAFRFYGETFGDDYSINRGVFVNQTKKILSSVHGMSAVDLMIKKLEESEV